ncbi:MAG: hypothetical protein EXX96DRAFT_573763, partial [Benjaminiella poitrasii]
MRHLSILFLSLYALFISCTIATIEQNVIHHQPSDLINIKSMLEHHNKPDRQNAHVKHFKGESLAYVTPWNNRG